MDFNIKPLGVSVEEFRSNPKLQIEAAAKLAEQFKSQFTEEDRRLAKEKGYNENALLAGAWLGGVGGVRKVLRGEGNPSDKHWSKEGKGTTVKDRMDKFNKMQKGGTIKPSFEEYYKTVPLQKNDTTNYNLRRAYDLAPYKDMVRFAKEPEFHLNSVYLDPKTGIYNFVKSRNHPTVQLEIDWYNSPEGSKFKEQYDLDTTGEYYRYIPRKKKRFQSGGVLKYEDGNTIKYGTKEYTKSYNDGNLTRYDKTTDTYVGPDLEEVKVVAKDYNPVGVAVSKKLNNVGNSITQNAIEFSPLAPVLGATKIATSYMNGSTNYGEHTDAWKSVGIDAATLGAFAIAKPVLQITSKTLKQPIKKYGTRLANKLENRFPNAVDKFHTWNAKDNINNMLMHEVIKNKKSRLIAHEPNYVEDWNRIKSDPFNTPNEAEHFIKRDFPMQSERVGKLNNIKKAGEINILERVIGNGGIPEKIYYNSTINPIRKHDFIFDNLYHSFASGDKKSIHLGTKIIPDTETLKSIPATSFQKGSTYAHELDHIAGWPTSQEFKEMNNLFGFTGKGSYISNSNNNGSEMKARLGQLKDLFGLKGNEPISNSQLKVAAKIYSNPNKYKVIDNLSTQEGFDFRLQNLINPFRRGHSRITELKNFMNKTSLKQGGKL